jgi:hypothetical protein
MVIKTQYHNPSHMIKLIDEAIGLKQIDAIKVGE